MIPRTPFYQNPVFWTTFAAQAGGAIMALTSYLLTVPGLPRWVPVAAGGLIVVGAQLGFQAHSATVRTAELANPAAQVVLNGPPAGSTVTGTIPTFPAPLP